MEQQENKCIEEADVIIIGAGMAGISAACRIKQQNKTIKVIILEADNRIGGRIVSQKFKSSKGTDFIIDLGAAWIHGSYNNPFISKCEQFGLTFAKSGSTQEIYASTGSRLKVANDDLSDAGDAYGVLLSYIESLALSPEQSLKTSKEDAWQKGLKKYSYDKEFSNPTSIKTQVLNFYKSSIEQFEAASFEELAWNHDENYKEFAGGDVAVKGGYIKFVEKLADGLDFRLEHKVEKISYKENFVSISCSNGKTFVGKSAVVTLPLGVLQKEIVTFQPPLPDWKMNSMKKIGFGLMNKLILHFESAFWNKNVYALCYASEISGEFRWFWNALPGTGEPVLIAFMTAGLAWKMEDWSDDALVSRAIAILEKIYGTVSKLKNFHVTRWGKNPLAFGSYSFVKVGSSPDDYENAKKPVGDSLFFAGEHTHLEYSGCVHGAYFSGERAGDEVVRNLQKKNK